MLIIEELYGGQHHLYPSVVFEEISTKNDFILYHTFGYRDSNPRLDLCFLFHQAKTC